MRDAHWAFRAAAQTILTGAGAIESLTPELDARGIERVFLLAGGSAGRGRAGELVRSALGNRVVGEFAELRTSAPEEDVEAAAAAAAGAQAVVALGGGSVSDAAKAVVARLPETPLLVAVPTTLSGAELTGVGVISVDGAKRHFLAPGETVFAGLVVYDPESIADVPSDVLLTTGMNGLAHCLEGYYSRHASPLSDALALRGAVMFALGLQELAAGDRSGSTLSRLLAATACGGLTLHHARAGAHHAICHAVFDAVGASHGSSNSAVLPYALEFNLDASREEQAELAAELGSPGEPLAALIARLQRTIGVPSSLREIGVEQDQLAQIADGAFSRSPPTNPRLGWSAGDLMPTLERAWAGSLS